MRRSNRPIVIAARRSRLSQVQANAVRRGLLRVHPTLDVQMRWVTSAGDQAVDVPLAQRGGKGMFTSTLEAMLLEGEADVAVHSLKDVPSDVVTPGLSFAAIPARGPVGDVLLTSRGPVLPSRLPEKACVGTASPRRAAQLRRLRPDIKIALIRGNVGTRLEKLEDEESGYDATLLAAAGLARLGMKQLVQPPLPLDDYLPAAGQGALCLQCRADDHVTITRCLPLNDPATSTATHAEREVVRLLGADCHSPIAVYAEPVDPSQTVAVRNADSHWFRLRARVLSSDGSQCLDFDEQVKTRELRRLVKTAAEDLKSRGADDLLEAARLHPISALPSRRPTNQLNAFPAGRSRVRRAVTGS